MDIKQNFWDDNPDIALLSFFKKNRRLLDPDKGNKLMWKYWYKYSPESPWKDMTTEEREIECNKIYSKDEPEWEEYYKNHVIPYNQKRLLKFRKMIEDRENEMMSIAYDITTAEQLDKMFIATDKIYKTLANIEKELLIEQSTQLRGNTVESFLEQNLD